MPLIIPSSAQRRRQKIGIVIRGQSNEGGAAERVNSSSADMVAAYPQAFGSLRNAGIAAPFDGAFFAVGNTGFTGGPWYVVYDALWDAGYEPLIVNRSIGGLSFVGQISGTYAARPGASTSAYKLRVSLANGDYGDWGTSVCTDGFLWYCSKGNLRITSLDNAGPQLFTDDGTAVPINAAAGLAYYGSLTTAATATLATCKFNGSIIGTALTVNSVTSGALAVGQYITDGGSTSMSNVKITSGSGSSWTLSGSPGNVSGVTMYAATPGDIATDGGVQWTCVGNHLASGIAPGTLVRAPASGGWDPLGIVRQDMRAIQRLRSAGCTKIVVIICNGQSDEGASVYNYQKTVEDMTGVYRAAGALVMLGLSTYQLGGSVPGWNNLTTAINGVKTTYTADSGVFLGANLYQLMGTTAGAGGLSFNTVVVDGKHINAPSAITAGGYHAAALLAYLNTLGSGWAPQ